MQAISKNVYFDVLDYIVDEYNNAVLSAIGIKPMMSNLTLMLNTMLILMKKILNLKLVVM